MSTNNSHIDNSPFEPFITNNENQFNNNQLQTANNRQPYPATGQNFNKRYPYDNSYIDRTDGYAYRLHLEERETMYAKEEYEQQQVDDQEEYAAREQFSLTEDEIEQTYQIATITRMHEDEEEEEQHRREQSEQQQLNEFQIFNAPEQLQPIEHDIIEQLNQTDTVDKIEEEHPREPNNEELLRFEKQEHVAFSNQTTSKKPLTARPT